MERFFLRRAVERLRDGLFDPLAVNRLTVEKDRIESHFSKGLKALEKGKSAPLCVLGPYGQGKSHTLSYLNQLALSRGYATSAVQLDLREIPFHQFPLVYLSIMERLALPDGKKLPAAWKSWADKESLGSLEGMPHRFKMVLTAMTHKNRQLTPKESSLKKYRDYRPKEYGYWLEQALLGREVPLAHLKSVCKYREVEGYKEHSLLCRGNDSYFRMVQSLGRLLVEMGYKGLLLFFDEAESIAQGRVTMRAKGYQLLDSFFQARGFVYPLFAFTDDFFEKVKSEEYGGEKCPFPKNYSEAWGNVNLLRLQDFSSQGWNSLLKRLMELYSQAYQVDLPEGIVSSLQNLLSKLDLQETRFKLKALVNKLDIEAQKILLDT